MSTKFQVDYCIETETFNFLEKGISRLYDGISRLIVDEAVIKGSFCLVDFNPKIIKN